MISEDPRRCKMVILQLEDNRMYDNRRKQL